MSEENYNRLMFSNSILRKFGMMPTSSDDEEGSTKREFIERQLREYDEQRDEELVEGLAIKKFKKDYPGSSWKACMVSDKECFRAVQRDAIKSAREKRG